MIAQCINSLFAKERAVEELSRTKAEFLQAFTATKSIADRLMMAALKELGERVIGITGNKNAEARIQQNKASVSLFWMSTTIGVSTWSCNELMTLRGICLRVEHLWKRWSA